MSATNHFLASEINAPEPNDAHFHILPVPYEKTVSYGAGTNIAPKVIIEASNQLETWDGKSNPSEVGIYTHPFINCSPSPEVIIENIKQESTKIIQNGHSLVGIGGEHTVTYGFIQGILNAGYNSVGIVQIDAHADLRDTYENSPLNHACVMKRCFDLGAQILQLGTRAYCDEEKNLRDKHNILAYDAIDLVSNNIQHITLPKSFPEHIFITVDVDGLDTSIMPATGTPVPGGLGWYQTLNLIESIAKQRKILGFDVVEYAPIPKLHAFDFTAAQLIYNIMGIISRNQLSRSKR